MPLERTIVSKIERVAERHGWLAVKIHGGPMQRAGLPDLLCLKGGMAVWLEVKQPGLGKKSEPTALQRRRMAELSGFGGCRCHVVHSAEAAEEALLAATTATAPYRTAVDGQPARCERRNARPIQTNDLLSR
jgi:hypothetical protein